MFSCLYPSHCWDRLHQSYDPNSAFYWSNLCTVDKPLSWKQEKLAVVCFRVCGTLIIGGSALSPGHGGEHVSRMKVVNRSREYRWKPWGVKERTATVTSSSSYAQYILANHRPERAYHPFLKEVINVNVYNISIHFNSCFWSQLLLQWTSEVSITSFEFSPFNWVKWNTVLHLTLNLKQWTTKQIFLLILWRTYIKSLNAVTAEELQYKWICL